MRIEDGSGRYDFAVCEDANVETEMAEREKMVTSVIAITHSTSEMPRFKP